MKMFHAETYKEALKTATCCDTCEKVPLPELEETTRYVFISYSHKDFQKVYADLADLYESGVPFWYDSGLPAGKNWDDVVREKMTDPRCAGIVFYLSESLFVSRSIRTEIHIACGKDGAGDVPAVKREYFSVNLTDMCPSKLLRTALPSKQFSDTEDEAADIREWVTTLTEAFPDKATYLLFDHPHHKTNLVEQIGINFGINPNYNPFAFGEALFRSGNAVIDFPNGAEYDGAFADGVFNGHGTLTFADGTVYVGEWVNGMRHGEGTQTLPNGASYTGEWADGSIHGKGCFTFSNGTYYKGDWKKGNLHGNGVATFANGSVYTGEWANGKWHGCGTMTLADGSQYTGDWVNGERTGQGTMTYANGSRYVGEWARGVWNGYGRVDFSDGAVYSGDWVDGAMQGQGTLIDSDMTYMGGWRENLQCGYGVMMFSDGTVYVGEWVDGNVHGRGILTLPDGSVQNGLFENGEFIGSADENT